MIQLDRETRARVIKLDGDVATLGVFVEGVWARVQARTEVRLNAGQWIRGLFTLHGDGETVFFRVTRVEAATTDAAPTTQTQTGGIDLEA